MKLNGAFRQCMLRSLVARSARSALMAPTALTAVLAFVGVAAPGSVAAGEPATSVGRVLDQHDRAVTRFVNQPLDQLELVYLRCSREAERGLLGMDEAAMCSIASEALLKRRFDSNFEAMLAWWRANRHR